MPVSPVLGTLQYVVWLELFTPEREAITQGTHEVPTIRSFIANEREHKTFLDEI